MRKEGATPPSASLSSIDREDSVTSTSVVGKRWRLSQPQAPCLSTIDHLPPPPPYNQGRKGSKPAAVNSIAAASEDIAFIDDDFSAGTIADLTNATVV